MPSMSLKIVQDDGAVTRKVKFDSRMTIKDAHKVVKDKVIVPDRKKEYSLFLRSTDDNLTGIWLQDDKTLEYYMLKDGDSLDYICRVRNLRVRLLDGTAKTLQVDEAKSVGELMVDVCARIGITNHDEYGLCREETEVNEAKDGKEAATGTLTLRKKPQQPPEDALLKQLCLKLKTDDNVDWLDQHRTLREQGVDSNETLLLKRRLFFSDRNVDARDPLQLHLLYVQTRDAILVGRHPVTEQQAAECKVRWINIRDVHRRILKKTLAGPNHSLKQYKYDNELEFMKQFYRDMPSLEEEADVTPKEPSSLLWSEVLAEQSNRHSSDDSDVPIKKPKTKKKRSKKKEPCFVEVNQTMPSFSEIQTSELDPSDPVDAFLLSIGATLKTFSPYHLNVAKSKIFNVVQEHDLQQIVERQKEAQSEGKVSTSESTY